MVDEEEPQGSAETQLLLSVGAHLRQEDPLSFLRSLPSQEVALVLTVAPRLGDPGIPQGEEAYLTWSEEWLREATRVLKPGGTLVTWGSLEASSDLRLRLLLDAQEPLVFQGEVIWHASAGGRRRGVFSPMHRIAWCHSRGPVLTFHEEAVRADATPRRRRPKEGVLGPQGPVPTSVWEYNEPQRSLSAGPRDSRRRPVILLERFIHAHTLPGDIVLDPFLASGDTVVAALQTLRRPWGAEASQESFEALLPRVILAAEGALEATSLEVGLFAPELP